MCWTRRLHDMEVGFKLSSDLLLRDSDKSWLRLKYFILVGVCDKGNTPQDYGQPLNILVHRVTIRCSRKNFHDEDFFLNITVCWSISGAPEGSIFRV